MATQPPEPEEDAMATTFEDRKFLADEATYARIEQGLVHDVTAELMTNHLQASPDEEA